MKTLKRQWKCRSGSSAIEFAILSPLFILVLFSIAAYGIYFGAAVSVQQLAADTARYALAGLTASERQDFAHNFIAKATIDDPLIDPKKLAVQVSDDPKAPSQFIVSLKYDAEHLPIWNLFAFPLPSDQIERSATIRIGGV